MDAQGSGCLDSGRLQEVTALMPCSLELRRQQLLSHQLLPGLSPPDLGNRESDFALRLLPKAGGLPEKGPSGSMESGIPGPRPQGHQIRAEKVLTELLILLMSKMKPRDVK